MSHDLLIKGKIGIKHRVCRSANEPGGALAQGHAAQAQAGRRVDHEHVADDGQEGSIALLLIGVNAEVEVELQGPTADLEADVHGVLLRDQLEGAFDMRLPSSVLAGVLSGITLQVHVSGNLRRFLVILDQRRLGLLVVAVGTGVFA